MLNSSDLSSNNIRPRESSYTEIVIFVIFIIAVVFTMVQYESNYLDYFL